MVRNAGPGEWGEAPAWTVEEQWRVGVVEGNEDQEFGHIILLGIGPHGRTYIVDWQAQKIHVFGRDGEFVRRIGGPGAGPGEFDSPLALAWDAADRLWVADIWNRQYTVFDTAGVVVKSVPRPVTTASRVGAHSMTFVGPNALMDESAWRSNGVAEVRTGFIRIDTAGAVLDTLPPLPSSPAPTGDLTAAELERLTPMFREIRPYRPRRIHTLADDGTIWLAESDRYRLVHREPGGDTLRIIEASHRDRELARADRRRIDDALAGVRVDASDLRLGPQIIRSINRLDDGHLLVQVEETSGEDGNLFDVFGPAGRFLGSLRFPVDVDSGVRPSVRGDEVVVVTRGAFDVPQVVKLAIRRN